MGDGSLEFGVWSLELAVLKLNFENEFDFCTLLAPIVMEILEEKKVYFC